ncbi:MAG: dihydroorotate dehydrogenase [Candidatus Odinarchaeum yellowstonii]|uniref:Dihydroorotate dehydrogenase n=1 Tax=Odinarchaeota yellowstonii (strain LCB_4) TaxID=1841599 RepID=A0AAF0IBQ7_ODILC|nr:MAG: dihydroorotate dehydrogenase [Candidatus Odinarchaeum yellowstonii]
MSFLETILGSIKLENPVIIASGVLATTGEGMKLLYEKGAGAVVTKTTTLNSKPGNPNPTIVSTPSGLLNSMGLPNPGIEEMSREVAVACREGVPVIGSVAGFSVNEFVEVAKRFEEAGVIGVELNISCPHEKVGLIGQDCKLTYQVVKAVKNSVKIPVIVKLTPNVTDIAEIALEAEKAGADALTAINTVKGMAIDVNTGYPILGAKIGGLSGPAIKPIAVRCIYEIYESGVKVPIIGVGGISNWRDALEFLMAGSSAIQIGTAFMKGYQIIEKIKKGLTGYMKKNKLQTLTQIIGIAHKRC